MKNLTVLITGCSSGFGFSMVQHFLNAGWRVIATMRQAEQRKEIFAHLPQERLHILNLDVTQSYDRAQAKKFIEQQCNNRLDCLVNNAGYGLMGALECLTEEEIKHQIEVNFLGTVLLTRALLPALRNANGKIFMLSSVFGYLGFPLTSLYCSSKFALEGFSEALYYELQPFNVQVCLVEPANHRTNFGKNMRLDFTTNQVYEQQTQNYLNLRDNINTNPNDNADKVAKIILRLAEKNKIPLRVRSGKSAHLVYFLRRLLPIRLYHWLLGHVYHILFMKPLRK